MDIVTIADTFSDKRPVKQGHLSRLWFRSAARNRRCFDGSTRIEDFGCVGSRNRVQPPRRKLHALPSPIPLFEQLLYDPPQGHADKRARTAR